MREVGEVGLLLKDLHTVSVNEPFCPLQLRLHHVNDLEALGRRVQFGKEVLGNGLALAVPVEDDPHGRASMVFFLDCRHKFLRAGVLHAFAHAAVRAQEVDPSHGQRGVRRFPGIRFFGVSHKCRVLRHLKQSVVQRVLRQQAVEFLTGQLLIENRKGRVIEPDGLLVIGQQLILLRPQVHRVAQGQAVFLFRRVQLVIGGFQRRGKGAVQGGKHGLTAFRQVSVVCDDGLHGRPHGGQNKVALFPQDIALLFPNTKRVRTPPGKQHLIALILFTKLGLEVYIVVDNRANLFCDLPPLCPTLNISPVRRILLLFSPVQIAVCGDQFPDTLLHLGPGNFVFAVGVLEVAGDGDTLTIVIFPIAAAGYSIGASANTILISQKFDIFLLALLLLKLFINAKFPCGHSAAAAQDIVYGLLGQSENFSLFSFSLFNECDLLRFAGQGPFLRVEPLAQQDHPLNGVGNMGPAQEVLFLAGEIRPAPEVQHIVPCPIPGPLAIAQNFLHIGVVEEALNEIAALFSVLMGFKERGDLDPMVF